MAITPATLRLEQHLRGQLDDTLDAQVRALTLAWARAWDEVAGDLEASLAQLVGAVDRGEVIPRGLMLRNQRLQNSLATIAEKLDTLADQAGVRISGDMHPVVRRAWTTQHQILSSQFPREARPRLDSRIDAAALEAIVRRSAGRITADTYPLADDAYEAVRRELVRGVAAGANPRHTAKRMLQRAEGEFNGGLARALTIARTETVDAHRAGATAGQDQNRDLLAGWIWLTHLRPTTCRSCIGMHGRLFPLEVPGPMDHPNGGCTRMLKTKSWAELGFGSVEEPADMVEDADAWFAALTRDQQRRILGRRGYDAWVAGDFDRAQWTKVRHADGWRDSQVAASPGDEDRGSVSTGGSGSLPPVPPAAAGGASSDDPHDDEPHDQILPATNHVPVDEPTEPAYRNLAKIADFVTADVENPRDYLTPREVPIADFLSEAGLETLGVQEARGKRPDTITVDARRRLEFKTITVADYGRIQAEARRASLKSRRVVIDATATALTVGEASAYLVRLAKGQVGARLDEIGLLLDGGVLVAWSRYE